MKYLSRSNEIYTKANNTYRYKVIQYTEKILLKIVLAYSLNIISKRILICN